MRRIADWLQSAGVSTSRRASAWSQATIRNIILNPVNKGEAIYGRFKRCVDEIRLGRYDDLRKRPLRTTQYYVERAQEEWQSIPAPAIVSAALWQVCQDRKRENQEQYSVNPIRKHLLQRLIRCPNCGNLMRGNFYKTAGVVYYNCKNAWGDQKGDRKPCHPNQYAAVFEAVNDALFAPELTPVERREVLPPLVRAIVPEGEGWRIVLRSLYQETSSEKGIQTFLTCVASRRNACPALSEEDTQSRDLP
jgi:hypothetical protein